MDPKLNHSNLTVVTMQNLIVGLSVTRVGSICTCISFMHTCPMHYYVCYALDHHICAYVFLVGSIAQWDRMKFVAGFYKLELAQFIELQSFSQFVADLGKETRYRLTKGRRLVEILKQFCGSPINLTTQMGLLSLANQNLAKGLAMNHVSVFLNLYLSVPVWALLFVPVRILCSAITFSTKM